MKLSEKQYDIDSSKINNANNIIDIITDKKIFKNQNEKIKKKIQYQPSVSLLPITIDSLSIDTKHIHDAFDTKIEKNEIKMIFKKKNIITELIMTEESYRDDLFVIEKIYKKKALEYSILSPQDIKIVFCNIYDIWQFTDKFSKLLRAAGRHILEINLESDINIDTVETLYSKLSNTWIGKAFSEMIPQIEKIYSIYCINHSASSEKLQELEQNTNIQKWLWECKEISKKQTNAWDLASLLIKPVQRILKYPLLLIQILNTTSANHPDIILLNHANKEITLVIDRINEIKRCKDMVKQVISGKSDNDICHIITKGISRRTKKLKQTVGLTENYHDIFYETLFQNFQQQQIQILTFKKKIKNWLREVTNYHSQQNNLVFSYNLCIACERSSYNETHTKWKEYKIIINEACKDGLNELERNITYFVFKPLKLLKNLYKIPNCIIKKRNTKILDYIHVKAQREKGILPSNMLVQSAEIYNVINTQLKKELPEFLYYTSELFSEIIIRFSYCQQQWYKFWMLKLTKCLPDHYDPSINFNDFPNSFMKKKLAIDAQYSKFNILKTSRIACSLSSNISNLQNINLSSLKGKAIIISRKYVKY
ncbi:uncharacterized protein T551_00718 [Pneumocystis jirovecii RU7]|uniref:DH domain-containing protein n=1 Tax=Pneumocystis jirovecii (strain RU7) TaxID=1408657 RepID=A0A0W4ZUM8_PNEJ7|nr:uncharacterized protein T551_00718 [Pneumocystis jirovecii RU7]KTW32036.1 hypothetical protein T551_00718 [Pneumocystis jirovecii RU7]